MFTDSLKPISFWLVFWDPHKSKFQITPTHQSKHPNLHLCLFASLKVTEETKSQYQFGPEEATEKTKLVDSFS